MPAAIMPFREAILELTTTGSDPSPELLGQLSQALNYAESDDGRRIRALLRWHASGSGSCSSYLAHEDLPVTLLLAEKPGALRAVPSAPDLSAAEVAGATRLVVGRGGRDRSRFDKLPTAAWDRLAAAAAEGDDEDKRDRLARRRAQAENSR